ncbi:chloride channel protein 2-like [Sinocyclocheilus rhinocerous]|uniref:chloride channel protein 2-like n=1 Tax=Sinocyclocheilus rhinocerous TaxID=307959 RepID=UPI0007B8EE1D|nr:PREDICTED: chloride channel protein 2-like [Sinocyclocheilus rhinocerous]
MAVDGTDENNLEQGIYTKDVARLRKNDRRRRSLSDRSPSQKCGAWASHFQRLFVSFIGADWIYLMILGFIMAVFSFTMDIFVDLFTETHRWIYDLADSHIVLQYLAWVAYSLFLMCFAAGFANIVSIQAAGSGIPETKTSLRGVMLQEYFTFKTLVSKVISLTCVLGSELPVGKELTQRDSLISFFDNRTWSNHCIVADFDHDDHLAAWKHPQANVFVILSVFVIMKFWMSALSITLPIPCGSFVPIFVIGAAFGRLVGEGLATLFPDGFNIDGHIYHIVPGAYAVIGAAALTAGVTHTISTGVIMMELTGQISYALPILISVILANMVSQSLQPSIYDTVIRIKKLPYLPMLSWGHREKYDIYVEDFMKREVRYITLNSTYRDVIKILRSGNLKTLPLVKSTESMLLLGSVERAQLLGLLMQRLQHLREENASTMPVRYKVHFQTSTEESASASTTKPLKSALKKPSVDEEEITSVYDSGLNLKKFFCSRPDIEAMEDDPDAEDDTILQEIEEWEEQQMDEQVNFNSCKIDPAPFQLVERTSLHKTHTMFSVLNLDYAYVTSIGRLVGVVSLKELRKAIEGCMPADGARLRPVLSAFRDRGVRGTRTETIELHQLLEHQIS